MSGLDRDILSPGHGAPTSAPSASVDILDPTGLLSREALANLRLEAAAALSHIPRPGEVRVRLLGDAEMAEAHLKYSDIPGTTDVLTFDLSEGRTATGGPLDVDILVCIDEARRQAATHQHAPEREALLYILHGVLHCLGHDDHDDDAFDRMHAEEDRILRAIGIGPLFDPGAPPVPPSPVIHLGTRHSALGTPPGVSLP
ncbi:MAG TPA: rRNA maturation RNase YbeY [Phycisphaerales bacterium]|nr:rRNA maturation RNase YbeY [Phycisphaerales bacterium]